MLLKRLALAQRFLQRYKYVFPDKNSDLKLLFQTIFKVICLCYHKSSFNYILTKIWDDFWPIELASRETQRNIKNKMAFVNRFCLGYLCSALISITLFMVFPLIVGNEMLPLESKFPFDHKKVPYYEIIYLWQYLSNYVIGAIISGYDFFLSALVMNIVAQFQILQDVMRNVYISKNPNKRKEIYEKLGIAYTRNGRKIERELFMKCVNHHKLLLL